MKKRVHLVGLSCLILVLLISSTLAFLDTDNSISNNSEDVESTLANKVFTIFAIAVILMLLVLFVINFIKTNGKKKRKRK
jgi:predicted membrane channel-forming protein YqfA (hemolysin III family)